MKELIEVFRMQELSKETRVKLIITLGRGINNQMGSNVTEGIVYELVSILDPAHPILSDEHYIRMRKLI